MSLGFASLIVLYVCMYVNIHIYEYMYVCMYIGVRLLRHVCVLLYVVSGREIL